MNHGLRDNKAAKPRRWKQQKYTSIAGIEIVLESDGVETHCTLTTMSNTAQCPSCKDTITPVTLHRCTHYSDTGTWRKQNELVRIFER